MKPTDRHDDNVLSCVARAILLLQSRAKLSAEERDYIEETIEIILAEFEEHVKSTAASTVQPVADDAAAGADA